MLLLDGKPLSYDKAFTHEGIQYPSNWLRLSSLEQKESIGIKVVPDPPAYDQRFAWGYLEDGSLNFKDHQQLIEGWVSKVKESAGSMLSQTDWYIVRRADTGTEVPPEILDRRAEIRSFANSKEQAILASADSAALRDYVTSPAFSFWSQEELSAYEQSIAESEEPLAYEQSIAESEDVTTTEGQ